MTLNYIEYNSKPNLIFNEKELTTYNNEKYFLTYNGALNFISSLSTLYLVDFNINNTNLFYERFEQILKADNTILGTIKKYMYSYLLLKIKESDLDIVGLIQNLQKTPYSKQLKLNYSIFNIIEEQIIENIGLFRNIELGKFLIKNVSNILINSKNDKLMSNIKIIETIPQENFQEIMINLINSKIKGNESRLLQIKKLIYNCNLYINNAKNNDALSFAFCLDVKKDALLFEFNLKQIISTQNDIVNEVYKKLLDKRNNKGKNQGPKL